VGGGTDFRNVRNRLDASGIGGNTMSLIARRVHTTARRSPQQVDRGANISHVGLVSWTESKRSLFERSRLQSRNDAGANRQYLFDCWGAVSARIHAVKMIRLFLDFDGTLTHDLARRRGTCA